ncbi:questin oxidase family protein [Nocardia sp. CA2R105]|uniref:questin oxidase family protein n=1 Tax=Nocardia coffeae TaxID=2873381 RepID=UPI001CA747F1|nr:questin oxidase family protein [Nocardia coffeae]MBY8861814.1 questin oxidase family protein [Nocardia coffeae]
MPADTVASVADLLDDRSHHIEFNGHLTNHVKHAVIALAELGAPEALIRDYYKNYAQLTAYGFPLEPARSSPGVIYTGNWQEFLGQRVHFAAYCGFFDAEIARLGTAAAVAHYAPELLRGWIGAFTHAAIHLGWAVHAEHPGMIAEALAYLAFSFVPVVDEARRPAGAPAAGPWDALLELSRSWAEDDAFGAAVRTVLSDTDAVTRLHPELNRSGLQARVAAVAHSGIGELAAESAWAATLPPQTRQAEVRRAVTLLYLAEPGDFVVLHLITSLFAVEVLARTLDSEPATARLYDLYWAGARIILAAERKIPWPEKLRELAELYPENGWDHSDSAAAEFDVIARRSWLEEEEHNPKLVFVLRQWWNQLGWNAYRHAAGQFTRTPELPPSFEEPPTE